jgi:hypothetical protein
MAILWPIAMMRTVNSKISWPAGSARFGWSFPFSLWWCRESPGFLLLLPTPRPETRVQRGIDSMPIKKGREGENSINSEQISSLSLWGLEEGHLCTAFWLCGEEGHFPFSLGRLLSSHTPLPGPRPPVVDQQEHGSDWARTTCARPFLMVSVLFFLLLFAFCLLWHLLIIIKLPSILRSFFSKALCRLYWVWRKWWWCDGE